jgi:hypothetical protein
VNKVKNIGMNKNKKSVEKEKSASTTVSKNDTNIKVQLDSGYSYLDAFGGDKYNKKDILYIIQNVDIIVFIRFNV